MKFLVREGIWTVSNRLDVWVIDSGDFLNSECFLITWMAFTYHRRASYKVPTGWNDRKYVLKFRPD